MNKEKMEKAMEVLGELTPEQKAVVESLFEQKISEKEAFEKLGVDEEKFEEFFKAAADEKEKDVFDQELSADELDDVSGGYLFDSYKGGATCTCSEITADCYRYLQRYIYGNPDYPERGFPNCAATVEDGSWCGSNDACKMIQVDYEGMHDCSKAWK